MNLTNSFKSTSTITFYGITRITITFSVIFRILTSNQFRYINIYMYSDFFKEILILKCKNYYLYN